MIKFISKNTIEYVNGNIDIRNTFETNVTYVIELIYPNSESILFNETNIFSIKPTLNEPPRICVYVFADGENYYKTNEVYLTDFKRYLDNIDKYNTLEIARLEQRIKQLESKGMFKDPMNLNLKPAAVGSVITFVDGNKFELRQPYEKGIRSINGIVPTGDGKIDLRTDDLGLPEEYVMSSVETLLEFKNQMLEIVSHINERLSNVEKELIEITNTDVL